MFLVRKIPFMKNNFKLNISLCCRTIQLGQAQKHDEQIGEEFDVCKAVNRNIFL
jgi:hypothetical protein